MLSSLRVTASTLVLFFSLNLFAGLSEDYHALKNSGKNFQAIGTICELVAQLRFQEQYPEPEYRVVTGIAYNDTVRTIGELDLIVFDQQENKALLVGEVKCWKDPKGGLAKARDQRQRFLNHLRSNKPIRFKYLENPSEPFDKAQFIDVTEFISIAQKGTARVGFDYEFDYTLDELMQLRADIMSCQKSGECQRPQ
ncbi:hypothetical protein [Pseudobdellovibrio exovorus]|uniref:Uncharacterized protein n=1 Tax=Pseudobdellovibrio exovorus JSS TaxID=1184267 RepID=M4VS36_9BACT|nr:hypothetical protein [Pseudobdellovibrio exovorus]AGH95994.1 hypothetical protein A11Q_1778 [Pseudobdellovibrio exovorus JSS]